MGAYNPDDICTSPKCCKPGKVGSSLVWATPDNKYVASHALVAVRVPVPEDKKISRSCTNFSEKRNPDAIDMCSFGFCPMKCTDPIRDDTW